MTYETPQALRMALEQRLLTQSRASGQSIQRLRRRVVFERIAARLQVAEPGMWVLKGGMALEVRLPDDARRTKDIDVGLRGTVDSGGVLRERLTMALSTDPFSDDFVIIAGPVAALMDDSAGHTTWRTSLSAHLAGKLFDRIQLDISPRPHELLDTEMVPLPNSLAFAGIATTTVEVIDVPRHAAEKFHAMGREFGDRENTRVRDLVDVMILHEHGMIDPAALAVASRAVWRERNDADPPTSLPALPRSWADRYQSMAIDVGLETTDFSTACAVATAIWAEAMTSREA